jgi:hypothetical protein
MYVQRSRAGSDYFSPPLPHLARVGNHDDISAGGRIFIHRNPKRSCPAAFRA